MEIILGSVFTFLKAHYGDVSISILTLTIITFYYKRVKPFLDSLPDLETIEDNRAHMDVKSKEIIENISSIKKLVEDLRKDIESIENNASQGEREFHNKMDGLMKDLNQISSKIETMMFLSIKGEIK